MAIDSRNDKDWNRQIEYMRKIIEEEEQKEKTIDEYIKDVWGNDVKKFIINSHAEAYIHRLERENQQLKNNRDKAIEYIENDMPYLEEPDDDYENNHKMKEYDTSVLLNILKGDSDE